MTELAALEAVFQKWLHLPDPGALHAVLGTVAANRLEGDPVWLLLVGPPGGGKSELLTALFNLADVHPAATITEAALLSGVPKREHQGAAKGGLLREIGDQGIIVAKDFGSVLSMNRDARSQLLAALREVYDGSWTRHVGTDGGRALHWAGRVGFVGGVTPTIDRHHAVMGAMGERFILYRLPEVDPTIQARHALSHAGHEKQMRHELATATEALLDETVDAYHTFENEDAERLIEFATLVVRARSAVERDGYSRDIELIPDPEAPTRLVIVLRRLLQGLDQIGLERDRSWQVIAKAALDSVPAIRLSCLFTLYHEHDEARLDTNEIATRISYPAVTTRRTLEDLTAHGLVNVIPNPGKAHTWGLEPFTQARLASFPVMSSSMRQRLIKGVDLLIDSEHPGKAPWNGSTTPETPTSSGTEPNAEDMPHMRGTDAAANAATGPTTDLLHESMRAPDAPIPVPAKSTDEIAELEELDVPF